MRVVCLRSVTKKYGSRLVLEDVSLEIEAGELFVLLGPSGCGKTTLLRIVAGLEVPDQGEVWLKDTLVSAPHRLVVFPVERRLGMVFQDLALWPHMTVADNVRFVLRQRAATQMEERVADWLERVGMTEYGSTYPSQLSGGQQQLVAIARALALEPLLLLLDEPLAGVDPHRKEEMRAEIRRLNRDLGITMLYVTHDQEDAWQMAHRIAVMNRGHIEQVGSPEDIYRHPQSAFVAGFIGRTNLLPATWTSAGRLCTAIEEFSCDPACTARRVEQPRNPLVVLRPEDITVAEEAGIPATVVESAYLGGFYLVHARVGDTTLLIRSPQSYRPPETVHLCLPDSVWVVSDES